MVDVKGPFPSTAAAAEQSGWNWFGRRRLTARMPGPGVLRDEAQQHDVRTSLLTTDTQQQLLQQQQEQQDTKGYSPRLYPQPVARQHQVVLLQEQQLGRA